VASSPPLIWKRPDTMTEEDHPVLDGQIEEFFPDGRFGVHLEHDFGSSWPWPAGCDAIASAPWATRSRTTKFRSKRRPTISGRARPAIEQAAQPQERAARDRRCQRRPKFQEYARAKTARPKDIMQFQFINAPKGKARHAIFLSHRHPGDSRPLHSSPILSRRELQRIVADMID